VLAGRLCPATPLDNVADCGMASYGPSSETLARRRWNVVGTVGRFAAGRGLEPPDYLSGWASGSSSGLSSLAS
jgi:hypothetical protein